VSVPPRAKERAILFAIGSPRRRRGGSGTDVRPPLLQCKR